MLEILPVTMEHAFSLAPRIREADRMEAAALGEIPEVALLRSVVLSQDSCWSFIEDGEVLCILGVLTHQSNSSVGVPWMISSEEAFSNPRRFLQHNKPIIDVLSIGYSRLLNIVHKDNHKAIKWLKWCGFEFDRLEHIEGELPEGFRLFSKEIGNV